MTHEDVIILPVEVSRRARHPEQAKVAHQALDGLYPEPSDRQVLVEKVDRDVFDRNKVHSLAGSELPLDAE